MAQDQDTRTVRVLVDGIALPGDLGVPAAASGIVLFAHGSGSSRLSPRNTYVARELRTAHIGTLLFDLLTEDEDQDYNTRFDIGLLARRLVGATRWMQAQPEAAGREIGYFGASTGSAAALVAAAELGAGIRAVVSRGGRPDLAEDVLPTVTAPTLLIVGGNDLVVLDLNRHAFDRLVNACVKQVVVIPGATHLFEEPGTLEAVAALATDWFRRYLSGQADEWPHAA